QRDSQDGCPTLGTPLRLEWCRRHSTIGKPPPKQSILVSLQDTISELAPVPGTRLHLCPRLLNCLALSAQRFMRCRRGGVAGRRGRSTGRRQAGCTFYRAWRGTPFDRLTVKRQGGHMGHSRTSWWRRPETLCHHSAHGNPNSRR